jgi:hypothetical protein
MKRIPVNWLCQADASASEVTIHIRSSELPIHSIPQRGIEDARSLSQIQKMNMEQMRQWQKFPARILRSL